MSMKWKKFNSIDEYCKTNNCKENQEDKVTFNTKLLSKKMQYAQMVRKFSHKASDNGINIMENVNSCSSFKVIIQPEPEPEPEIYFTEPEPEAESQIKHYP